MVANFTNAILRVVNSNGKSRGTAFFVAPNLAVTCAHVIEATGAGPGETVDLIFHATKEPTQAHIVADWWRAPDAEDVAVLRLEGELPAEVAPLPLGSSAETKGGTFSTFGFPDAKPVEGMSGKCEVIGETTEQGLRVLQIRSDEVTPGFSGAPVWDAELEMVVGIITSVLTQDQYGKQRETAFYIPVETLGQVCPFLGKKQYQTLKWEEADVSANLAKAIDLCKQVAETFQSQYLFANECDQAYQEILAVWDENLHVIFLIFKNATTLPNKPNRLSDGIAMQLFTIHRIINEIAEDIKDFRSYCGVETSKSRKKHNNICRGIESLCYSLDSLADISKT